MKVFVFGRDHWRNPEAGIYVVAYNRAEAREMVKTLSFEWKHNRRDYCDYLFEMKLDDALESVAKAQAEAEAGWPGGFVAEIVAVGRAKNCYVHDNAAQALQRAFEVAQASEWR